MVWKAFFLILLILYKTVYLWFKWTIRITWISLFNFYTLSNQWIVITVFLMCFIIFYIYFPWKRSPKVTVLGTLHYILWMLSGSSHCFLCFCCCCCEVKVSKYLFLLCLIFFFTTPTAEFLFLVLYTRFYSLIYVLFKHLYTA